MIMLLLVLLLLVHRAARHPSLWTENKPFLSVITLSNYFNAAFDLRLSL